MGLILCKYFEEVFKKGVLMRAKVEIIIDFEIEQQTISEIKDYVRDALTYWGEGDFCAQTGYGSTEKIVTIVSVEREL